MIRVDFSTWLSAAHTDAVLAARDAASGDKEPNRRAERTYIGVRLESGRVRVTVCDETGEHPLNPRRDLRDFSEHLDWGYQGMGAHQLSQALLADALRCDGRALSLRVAFVRDYVMHISRGGFEITAAKVQQKADALEAELARAS